MTDVSSFLSKQSDDQERLASLEERTNYAIKLLQSLPCARFAVLEKIGEVFFDDAQQFFIELERQHLEGIILSMFPLPKFVTLSRKKATPW